MLLSVEELTISWRRSLLCRNQSIFYMIETSVMKELKGAELLVFRCRTCIRYQSIIFLISFIAKGFSNEWHLKSLVRDATNQSRPFIIWPLFLEIRLLIVLIYLIFFSSWFFKYFLNISFTVISIIVKRGWNYMGVEVFPQIFKIGGKGRGGQNKITLRNFGNIALKWGVVS